MAINIGIDENDREAVAKTLEQILADSYLLYLKTQNYHWNVTGPNFHSLHEMFEQQYRDLAEAVDTIAERIRAIGFYAPGSFKEYSGLSQLKEASGGETAQQMLANLQQDHEWIIRSMRDFMPVLEKVGDEETLDMIIGRLSTHEKTAWMLRSSQ